MSVLVVPSGPDRDGPHVSGSTLENVQNTMPHLLSHLPLLLACASATTQVYPWGVLSVEPWGGGVRARAWPPGSGLSSPALQALLPSPPPTSLPVVTSNASVSVGDLMVSIDAEGLLTYSRLSTGGLLFKQMRPVTFGNPTGAHRRDSVSTTLSFTGLQPNERVYGLGEHPGAAGKTVFESKWAEETNGVLTIPFFFSTLGYGLLYNVPAYGNVSLGGQGHVWSSDATPCVDLWVTVAAGAGAGEGAGSALAGSSPPAASQVLAQYADVVGHASPMPWAATGFWQSKNRYRNQSQLLGVARGFAARGVPLSVIVIDYLSWTVLGDDTLTPTCWPDPRGMFAELAALNVTVLVSLYPYQNKGAGHYEEFVGGGLSAVYAPPPPAPQKPYNGCLGGQTLYDAFNPAARIATFQAFVEGYAQYAAPSYPPWVWEDCSEPGRDPSLNGKWVFPGASTPSSDAEIGPAWTREHARMVVEGYAATAAGAGGEGGEGGLGDAAASSLVTLTRSFYPGAAALGAALWSGDINTTWDSLFASVRVLQQAVMSGVALFATDTGGYHGGNASDPGFNELLVRWTQFSALTPIFRFHGRREYLGTPGSDTGPCGYTNGDNEFWSYLPWAQGPILKAMALREGLRGYVMELSARTAATGTPMVLPLALAFPGDTTAQELVWEGEYMFGDKYLVQPVTLAGAQAVTVYLPGGGGDARWGYFFNSSMTWAGGQVINISTPLEEFPLFVRLL